MLVTFIDIAFALAGWAVIFFALARRTGPSQAKWGEPFSLGEAVLTGLALIPAAIGPNILVVALTPGMPAMPALTRWALIPSVVLLVAVFVTVRSLHLARLSNRIAAGLWIGAASTGVLDTIRLTGFSLGYMPGNMPRMFGVLILDTMALGPTTTSDLVGSLYHYWVGACFGLTYTLIAGRARWWGGVVWGLVIELGMMTTPPMLIAMDTGYFGLKWGYGVLVTSLLAHIAFGVALGVLVGRYVRHSGSIVKLLNDLVTVWRRGTAWTGSQTDRASAGPR